MNRSVALTILFLINVDSTWGKRAQALASCENKFSDSLSAHQANVRHIIGPSSNDLCTVIY